MRDLSAKLAMLGGQPKAPAKPAPRDCFTRETRYAIEPGMRRMISMGLEALLAIDPRLTVTEYDPSRVLFLDTETTGLSGGVGTVPFLIGLGWIEGKEFVLRQLLMRDYAEEPFVLQELLALSPRFDLIVTFNGKTFDLPLVLSRFVMHRMQVEAFPQAHLDLLHPTRAVYKLRLTRCPLGHIEEKILGLKREDDLPGREVPERYFEYLKTHEFTLLEDVLRHNDQDIRSLCVLMGNLADAYTAPEQMAFSADVLSLGRVMERRGQRNTAQKCFRVAATGEKGDLARIMLAGSLKRDAEYGQAEHVYLEMLRHGQGGVLPYIELAKLLEHKRRDYTRALAYTRAAERLEGHEEITQETTEALRHREQRLLRKIERKRQGGT